MGKVIRSEPNMRVLVVERPSIEHLHDDDDEP